MPAVTVPQDQGTIYPRFLRPHRRRCLTQSIGTRSKRVKFVRTDIISAMRAFSAIAVVGAGALLAGCSLPYYWQAASGQMALLGKRTPVEAVIEDPRTSAQTRESLRKVLEARRFAVDPLGLPESDSYTTYVDLERTYAVWNVVAADEFSVDPRIWCFPFAGCVSYRGYFDEASARRFAARLEADGQETAVNGAAAYSTLGYFADPVLNTMIAGPEPYLIEVLFHELAHQKFYLRDDSELNEAFATAVAEYGTQRWLMMYGDADAIDAYRERLRRRAQFAELVDTQRERLRSIYAGDDPVQAKRRAKEAAFDTLRAEYGALKQTWDGGADYDEWFSRPLNNARLASVATYEHWLPGLRWLLEARGLDEFYAEVETLGNLEAEARRRRLQGWLDRAGGGASTALRHRPESR